MPQLSPGAVRRVLHTWFEDLGPEDWFRADPALDRRLGEQLGDLHEAARGLSPERALADPEAALAAIILLDQLSRNLGRGGPAAFANDALALAIAEGAVARGYHRALSPERRKFLLMPFMHAEDLPTQERSVSLFAELGDPRTLDFARQHRDIVRRFGRFPHRNEALGRESTEEERAFLEGGPRFGQ